MWLKKGDTYPPLRFDTNADVTGATSMIATMRRVHQSQVTQFTLTAAIPSDGVIQYEWQPGDTDVPGTYLVEAEVTFADTSVQTFPQRYDLELVIKEDLA